MNLSTLTAAAHRLLAHLPGAVGWPLAAAVGVWNRRDDAIWRDHLAAAFAMLHPQADVATRLRWAQAHLQLRAWEMLDAQVFAAIQRGRKLRVTIEGAELVAAATANHALPTASASACGTLLLLTHVDRFLMAPLLYARLCGSMHMLTAPIDPALSARTRAFLLAKVRRFQTCLGGAWLTTDASPRRLLTGLARGETWVALPDAWSPQIQRHDPYPFLGGTLQLPAGLRRIAERAAPRLITAEVRSHSAARLSVRFSALPDDPDAAFAALVARLETIVRTEPWRWWQWEALPWAWRAAHGNEQPTNRA